MPLHAPRLSQVILGYIIPSIPASCRNVDCCACLAWRKWRCIRYPSVLTFVRTLLQSVKHVGAPTVAGRLYLSLLTMHASTLVSRLQFIIHCPKFEFALSVIHFEYTIQQSMKYSSYSQGTRKYLARNCVQHAFTPSFASQHHLCHRQKACEPLIVDFLCLHNPSSSGTRVQFTRALLDSSPHAVNSSRHEFDFPSRGQYRWLDFDLQGACHWLMSFPIRRTRTYQDAFYFHKRVRHSRDRSAKLYSKLCRGSYRETAVKLACSGPGELFKISAPTVLTDSSRVLR